jgi:putative hemolysin
MKTALLQAVPPVPQAAPYPFRPEALPRAEIRRGAYALRFARTRAELDAALRLRFEVFNLELREGLASSYLSGLDEDEFDATCHHLLVTDEATGGVVGTYRLRTAETALAAGGFYSAGEFDLSRLPAEVLAGSVETGRACVAREHRGRNVLFLLWQGLAAYLAHNRKRFFFGCCSLASQDARDGLRALNLLERGGHLHPTLRVPPLAGMECAPEGYFVVDEQRVELPRLFETYLRFGAKVCGPPAIDRAFKTIDFLVLLDTAEISERTRRLFFGG